jgi:hypothetical protein
MRDRIFAFCILPILSLVCLAAYQTQIVYETTDLGTERWKYTYDVCNVSLAETIEEFTIWFGIGSYDNLVIETLNPPASNWDEVVWDPEPFLGDDGGYDAWANLATPIGIGQSISGFAVSFDWLGTDEPGSQFYEIIDPETFETIYSGWTVPEPGTLTMLGLGVLALLQVRHKQK